MAIEPQHVMVMQDASKLNLKVFSWVVNGLSLKPTDMVTLFAILHEVYNPLGYKSKLDNKALAGVNQRIIEEELARKKEEFLNHEDLAKIAKLYDSNEVVFKVQLFAGSSPKNVAIENAIKLKATWMILDRQMKKDEELFLQKLSCGVSRVVGKTHIVRLRGPLDVAVEIQCNSHESYAESLPESTCGCGDVSNIGFVPKSPVNEEGVSQIDCMPYKDEGCSTFTPNSNKNDKNSNQITDKQCHDQEHIDEMMINNDETKDHEMIISHEGILDEQQERTILENSMCCSICSICKTRRPNIEWRKEFSYEELESATDGFSLKNCLSESGNQFSTFKGKLEGEVKIVVKQHEIKNIQVREKMKSEVQTILKVRHNNVVMLLGSSTQDCFMLTVYEFACNGSLDMYLSRERCRALTWSERVRVVIGLSRGLKYLHDNNIIHGNIKPSNILLTHDFNPLLGDFDLGKNLEPKNSLNNKSIGNSEYIAPEYEDKGKVSSKTDVYSFGVVILELITGRKAADKISGDKKLVAWAKPLLGGKKYSELVDPIISNTYEEEQLRWLVKVAAQCLKKKPKERFSMNMAVSALQGIADGEQCHITEDLTSDILQSIPNRKECYMKGDFPPVVSVISDSQGSKDNVGLKETDHQSPKEERTESVSFEKETIKVENNHFYMIDQQNSDILRQINEHVIGHDQEEEKSFAQVKRGLIPAPICGMIVQTNLINDKTQRQSSFYENLHDEHQDKIILVNPKSSACSICKSKRPKVVRMKDFTYDELLEATQGFSAENSLSEKEDGPTFKGMLESKVKIVVKKYQIARSQEEKIFKSEVQLFTNVKHKNVVMLLGLCTDKSQLMIVYEHVCNGSLDHYLSKGNFQSLTWMERVKVSVGTARGLKYLHGNNIIHGSIKASNILLTHDFEPLIGDFGLGKVKLEPMKSYKDKSARDFGYTAPEYLENGKLSTKTDVYSFGVVLLELITGRRAMDKLPGGKSLVGWARPLLGGKKYHQLMDPKISNSCEEEQLLWLVQVTEKCLKKNPKERYTMNMVVSALQGIAESDECCVVEEESPKNSYSPNDELSMPKTSSQGEMMAELVPREQEQIDRNTYKAEISFRTSITSNDMIDQINPDQQIEENHQHYKETIHLEKNGIFLNQNQGKTILENLKSSVCSICKSRRPNNGSQRKFTWEELEDATEGFSIKYSLSEGEYGPAFRGQLDNKVKIAIKKIQVTSLQEEKMFMTEVQLLANARHENMIMLLGSCIRENQLLVVYEYACNGSLDQYLSRKNGRSLNWRERVKIAIGLSRGLKYLHENNIIHGRVKPSNILLNHDFKPLVGDFMFRKERSELKNSHEDKCVRNCGYTAPECWDCGKLSTKGDVYSFGVILLELIAGCLISDQIPGHKCLVEWARPLLGGRKYLQLVDPKISSSYDEEELASLVLVTEKCLRKNPKERFTMNMVVSVMPFVVDSNEIYVIEDSSSSEKSNEECRDSYVASSKVEEELQDENKLGTKIGEEREDNIACSRKNSETESTSPMVFQDGGSCESYGGARDFFLQGAQEYIACEIFFSLCNSI